MITRMIVKICLGQTADDSHQATSLRRCEIDAASPRPALRWQPGLSCLQSPLTWGASKLENVMVRKCKRVGESRL